MASRDNQTLQILVISLVILVLLLGAGMLWLNSVKNTAVARANDAEDRASEADAAMRRTQQEANYYKQVMGFDESDSLETLQGEEGEIGQDLARFGASFPEDSRQYRTLLQNIFDENRQLAQSEAAAKEEVKQLKERLLATEQEKEMQLAECRETLQKVEQDAANQRNQFEQQRQQMIEEKNQIAEQLAQQRTRIDEMEQRHAQAIQERDTTISKLERVIEIQQHNIADPDPFAQPADGQIRYVDQRENKVWINIGSADDLRPQVTFSVYSSDATDVKTAQSKGKIEVIRIMGPHMAEARITSDESTRPLMIGDQIYSQVWNPGRQVGFAITGLVDLDNDGRSDIEKLKQVIRLNNGKVDAVPGPDGTVEGEMTVDTRYLILGEFPSDSRDESADLRQSWETMNSEANTLNIEAIQLEEFLSLMGWEPEIRSVRLGSGSRGGDFPALPTDEADTGYRSRNPQFFRPRQPPQSY